MYAIFIMLECLLIFNTQQCTARRCISRFISKAINNSAKAFHQRESVLSARKRFISAKAFYQRESVSSARKRFISAKAFHQRVNAFNKIYHRESVIAHINFVRRRCIVLLRSSNFKRIKSDLNYISLLMNNIFMHIKLLLKKKKNSIRPNLLLKATDLLI